MIRIRMDFDGQSRFATLDDPAVARDFAARQPHNHTLSDCHGIEKIPDLPRRLDTSAVPESYAPGGNLAIFPAPFPASRGLVRVGAFGGPVAALVRALSPHVVIDLVAE